MAAIWLAFGASAWAGTEYFVAPDGDDARDGLSRESAFASVQRGLDALEPGDTLTLAPGEYQGSVRRDGLGWPDNEPRERGDYEGPQTVIRAEIPGTAVLRGDVPAPQFAPVDGYRFVYGADFDGAYEVQALNELDTWSVLHPNYSKHGLEFNPGTFFQDREAGRLYVSSATMQPPTEHLYSVSVTGGHGLFLVRPYRVVVEGLAATGFNSAVQVTGEESSGGSYFGIFLYNATECVVRECTAWFNGRGIGIRTRYSDDLEENEGGDNLIEYCQAWANFSVGGGGAISLLNPNRDRLEHSTALLNGGFGLLLYGRGDGGHLRHSLAWGNSSDIQIKGYPAPSYFVERSVGPGVWGSDTRSRNAVHNMIGFIGEQRNLFTGNIMLADYPELDLDAEFADPVHHDYRLQSTSQFRGEGPDGTDLGPFAYEAEVFYVSPDGDDEADGLSVSGAWQSLEHALGRLKGGETLYLLEGTYGAPADALTLEGAEDAGPVVVRGRGAGPVVIEGALTVEGGPGLELNRLNFNGPVRLVGGAEVKVENCRFSGNEAGLTVEGVEGVRVEHNLFASEGGPGLDLTGSSGIFLQGNLFANNGGAAVVVDGPEAGRYSDYNVYTSDHGSWLVEGREQDLEVLKGWVESRSRRMETGVGTGDDGLPIEETSLAVADAAAHGKPAGPFDPAVELVPEETLRLSGPYLHSTTATTANLEWWISDRSNVRVEWSTNPEFPEGETWEVDLIGALGRGGTSTGGSAMGRLGTALPGAYSLRGLQPGTEYFARLTFGAPLQADSVDSEIVEVVDGASVTLRLQTAENDPEPAVYYVSTEGHDRHSGRSLEEAWRTIHHAANQARPGDTIKIDGGTYVESVHVRTTGDVGRPITFTPVPGGKVVFSGDQRTLTYFFYLSGKSHVNIDGFYFTDFAMGGGLRPWEINRNAAIMLYYADDVTITRCYMDRRGEGSYAPGILQAQSSSNVLVQNCVVYGAMGGGLGAAASPNLRLENNVFFRNFTVHVGEIINAPDQKVYIKNNIFTDVLPGKLSAPMIVVGRPESLVEDNNLFYARVPEADRNVIKFYNQTAYELAADSHGMEYDPESEYLLEAYERFTLPAYKERFGRETSSYFGDPIFAGTVGMERVDDEGNPIYLIRPLRRLLNSGELDHHFDILFATNPEVLERGIGLQPEAFEDFHFNR